MLRDPSDQEDKMKMGVNKKRISAKPKCKTRYLLLGKILCNVSLTERAFDQNLPDKPSKVYSKGSNGDVIRRRGDYEAKQVIEFVESCRKSDREEHAYASLAKDSNQEPP